MAGCARFNHGFAGRSSDRTSDSYAQSNLDELLVFGADMASKSMSSRADVCRSLLKRQRETPGTGIQLHLMVGRLLSDACGDSNRILEAVEAIPAKNLPDERVQRFVSIHTEALKRINTLSRRVGSLERKQKSVQTVLESKDAKDTKLVKGSKKDEARLLREKLEAIRSMEKRLDESGEGN